MITLEELVSRCKGSVSVEFNPHRDCYESIYSFLVGWSCYFKTREQAVAELGEKFYVRLVSGDSLVVLRYYPISPIGFHQVYGQTLEECLEQVEEPDFQ